MVKIDGGAVGILDNEAALLKWAVASSIISEILQDQEPSYPKDKDILKHHENTKGKVQERQRSLKEYCSEHISGSVNYFARSFILDV